MDRKEYEKLYREKHKEERSEYQKEYYKKNKEDRLAYKKEWYQRKKEEMTKLSSIVGARINKDLADRLKEKLTTEGKTLSEFMREAVEAYLQK